MFYKFLQHSGYYISLVIILILGFLLVYTNSTSRDFQIGVAVVTTFFYVIWGILHHLINHDLNSKIVVEYILIGLLGMTLIIFLLSVNGNY